MKKIIAVLISVIMEIGLIQNAIVFVYADSWQYLSRGFADSINKGYSTHGWENNYTKSYWGAYGGHNCTNYVGYMCSLNGVEPEYVKGDATAWDDHARNNGYAVDNIPEIGAIAQWEAYSPGYSSSGHVAYVEEVGVGYIIVSEDNWLGDFDWRRIESNDWPSNFLHIAPLTGDVTRYYFGKTIAIQSMQNGKYLTGDFWSWSPETHLNARADTPSTWETFNVVDSGGYAAFYSNVNNKYISVYNNSIGQAYVLGNTANDWEKFRIYRNPDRTINIIAHSNQQWLSAVVSPSPDNAPIKAQAKLPSDWKRFKIIPMGESANGWGLGLSVPPLQKPSAPSSASVSPAEMGIGDTISASWANVSNADKYSVGLFHNDMEIEHYELSGTNKTFIAKASSQYKIRVYAHNSAGWSDGYCDSGTITVHPNKTVTFIDADQFGNTVIAEKIVKWNGMAALPIPPFRYGWVFLGWNGNMSNVKSDVTVKATYRRQKFNVDFVDKHGNKISHQSIEYESAALRQAIHPNRGTCLRAGAVKIIYMSIGI